MSAPEASKAATDPAPKAAAGADAEYEAALRAELDRRIAALAEAGDASFGSIGRGEWIVTVIVTVVLPLLAVWALR